jgi:hypothetical protein
MAEIPFTDGIKIEDFLTPPATGKGYVLDFSNADFQRFIGSVAKIDIYEKGKYDNFGTSKANRLRSFFDKESDHVVGKVLLALAEYQQTLSDEYHSLSVEASEIIEIASKLMKGDSGEDGATTGKAYFEKIREQILSAIKEAEFTIWVAVAWFTDPILFESLLAKKAQGLNIQVIINDDEINSQSNLDYSQFEVYKLPPLGTRSMNRMHHKFCIIDFRVVIHGSYNWTKAARYNGETIEISSGYHKAKQFSQEFMKLKLRGINQ